MAEGSPGQVASLSVLQGPEAPTSLLRSSDEEVGPHVCENPEVLIHPKLLGIHDTFGPIQPHGTGADLTAGYRPQSYQGTDGRKSPDQGWAPLGVEHLNMVTDWLCGTPARPPLGLQPVSQSLSILFLFFKYIY